MATIEKVISPSKLAHVVLRTTPSNFKAMIQFYETFLGGTTGFENEFIAFITYDEEHHRIALIAVEGTGAKQQKTCGLEVRSRKEARLRLCFSYSNYHFVTAAYRIYLPLPPYPITILRPA
jgi:catechol-2,3-dioxygenase